MSDEQRARDGGPQVRSGSDGDTVDRGAQTVDLLERAIAHLAAGSRDRAEALIRFALLTADGANLVELSVDEVARLRSRPARLETPPARP